MPQDMAGADRFSSRITDGGSYSRQVRKASMQVSEQLSGYNVKVIAVTSALIHEGKSSIAFRLAKSFAGLGKKTIFVDCDIRNSHIITRYQVEGVEYGLSEFLSGNTYMLNIVYQTDDENLDIIFPGASAPNPSVQSKTSIPGFKPIASAMRSPSPKRRFFMRKCAILG